MGKYKNFFFKWLYHFRTTEKQSLLSLLQENNQSSDYTEQLIENSYAKFKRWINKNTYSDKDFERHYNKLSKNIYNEDKTRLDTDLKFLANEMESFIINSEIQDKPKYRHQILFDKAKQVHFNEAYFHHLDALEACLTMDIKTADGFYDKFKIQEHRYFHTNFDKDKTKVELNGNYYEPEKFIQTCWENLTKFNLLSQIKMACELRTRKAIFDNDFKNFSAKKILHLKEEILEFQFEDFPEAHIYLELFQWLDFTRLEELETFDQSKNFIISKLHLFSKNEQSLILVYLMNFVGKVYKTESEISIDWYYQLAKIGFEQIWTKEMPVESSLLMNIYDLTYQKYPNFAAKIITDYTIKLSVQEKNWMIAFFQARQAFNAKEYVKALKLVKPLIHHKNYGLTLRKYILMLQAKYELYLTLANTPLRTKYLLNLGSEEAIKETIINLKTYINKSHYFKQPSNVQKKATENFITIIEHLINQTATTDEMKKQLNQHPTYSYTWLAEKIDAYPKKYDYQK